MGEYSWFQSILQLSVALNMTFSVVFSLFDNMFGRERAILVSLREGVDALSKNKRSPEILEQRTHDASAQINSMISRLMAVEEKIHLVTTRIFRPIGVLCAAIAFLMLLTSSFLYSDKVGCAFSVIAILTICPFVVLTGFVFWQSQFVVMKIQQERRKLDSELT